MRTIALWCGILMSLGMSAKTIQENTDTVALCCVYRHSTITTDLRDSVVEVTALGILEVGTSFAKYGDLSASAVALPKSLAMDAKNEDPRKNDYITVFQNYPDAGNILVREALLPGFYVYTEQTDLHWELCAGEDTVLGYECKKATTTYAGRKWIASYSCELPAAHGPWKFSGLPGLIMKVESEDGIHTFTAASLFHPDAHTIKYEPDKSDVEVKRGKFITLRNRLKTDKRWAKSVGYYMNAADFKSLVIIKEGNKYNVTPQLIINGISFPVDCKMGYYFKPLELK